MVQGALADAARSDTAQAMEGPTHGAARTILATPRAVFRALIDAELMPKWRAPGGMNAELLAFEPRVGGGYKMVLTYDDPAAADPKSTADPDVVEVVYQELLPDERIVENVMFESADPRFAGTMTLTTTLRPVTGGTKVSFLAENVPAGISEADHRMGMEHALKSLASLLE